MWGPRSMAKLVNITAITGWFMVLMTISTWGYKPTNITFGGPTLYILFGADWWFQKPSTLKFSSQRRNQEKFSQ